MPTNPAGARFSQRTVANRWSHAERPPAERAPGAPVDPVPRGPTRRPFPGRRRALVPGDAHSRGLPEQPLQPPHAAARAASRRVALRASALALRAARGLPRCSLARRPLLGAGRLVGRRPAGGLLLRRGRVLLAVGLAWAR